LARIRLASTKLTALALAALCILASLLLVQGRMFQAAVVLLGASAPAAYMLTVSMKRSRTRLDMLLVTSVIHMYAVSLGEAGPDRLIETVAESPEYGFYSRVFKSIRRLAKEFGYGFGKAIFYVSNTVKSPLKDMLVRFSEGFSSPRLKEFLELELSTIMEEYSGFCTRMLESMRLLGGMFSTFQSVSVFVVMTVAILTIFMADENIVIISYIVAASSIAFMFVGFRMVAMREPLVYTGRSPSNLYRLFKTSFLATVCALPVSVAVALTLGVPYGLISAGALMLVPGALAYKLEAYVTSVDENYPVFLKALGESLASTSNLKAALDYVLYMELGPLKQLISRLSTRLKIGVSGETAFNLLASESSSHKVYMFNKIFLDAFRSGANTIEVGKTLGNSLIKFQEFRKRRISVTKSFEGVVMALQPITVALLVVLGNLCKFFTSTLTSLPYFQLGQIPLDIINAGNTALVILVTVVNSLAIKEARGGFWGSSLLYAGILFIVSGGVWIGAEHLIEQMFSQLQAPTIP
jgi:archaellum biogenesis protein FlaJ (TadC family)